MLKKILCTDPGQITNSHPGELDDPEDDRDSKRMGAILFKTSDKLSCDYNLAKVIHKSVERKEKGRWGRSKRGKVWPYNPKPIIAAIMTIVYYRNPVLSMLGIMVMVPRKARETVVLAPARPPTTIILFVFRLDLHNTTFFDYNLLLLTLCYSWRRVDLRLYLLNVICVSRRCWPFLCFM